VEALRVHAEQHDRQTADRHAESLYTVPGVSDTEQFAVRVHVQFGRGHVPSDVSVENIHDSRILGADTETQALQTPVDRAGRVDRWRRTCSAKQHQRQNATYVPRPESDRRPGGGPCRVLLVRIRRRLF